MRQIPQLHKGWKLTSRSSTVLFHLSNAKWTKHRKWYSNATTKAQGSQAWVWLTHINGSLVLVSLLPCSSVSPPMVTLGIVSSRRPCFHSSLEMLGGKHWRRPEQVGYTAFGHWSHSFSSLSFCSCIVAKSFCFCPCLPFRSLLTLWLGTLPCGHPKGGALYKGHGSPDAKHKQWLSWVHIVLLTTLQCSFIGIPIQSTGHNQTSGKSLGGFPLTSSNNEAASFLSPRSTVSDFLQWTANYQLPDTK